MPEVSSHHRFRDVWANSGDIISKKLVSGDNPEDGDGFWDMYKTDLDNAKKIGLNSFRMSIEWARIFPDATFDIPANIKKNENNTITAIDLNDKSLLQMGKIADKDSVNHYIDIFNYARSLGMNVLLTLYHWPLPLWLHDPVNCHLNIQNTDKNGWLNDQTLIEFGKYTLYASKVFSKYVDIWETINEPEVISFNGYFYGDESGFLPGLNNLELAVQVLHNLALAHNIAYKNIKKFTSVPVGFGIAPQYREAGNSKPETIEYVKFMNYMGSDWFINAAVNGYFDNDIDMVIDKKENDIGNTDYIGIDYYSRETYVYDDNSANNIVKLPCKNCTDFDWDIYPPGIRSVLNWIYEKYRFPLYILENGIADSSDSKRKEYIKEHIKELWNAINIDKIPVKGYYHWSLIDNFEWAKGYGMRFGLFEVDYQNKKRKIRPSAYVYKEICESNGLKL